MRNLILLLTMLFSSVTFGALSEVDRQEIGYTNYIKNGGCESGIAGLGRYADAAGTRPVDGTGGAPTVSVSASATAPLIGKASCIFTKSAAILQGQGWSIPFTIEEGAKGKVLSVEFLYKVDSGTFAAGSSTTDSDVIAYLYDVTNGVVIEPTSFKLFSNSTTLADKFSGYFQAPSNSTSYRLIFHVATVSASAYALKVDDIAVSRSKITSGAVVTDWKSYTLTIDAVTTAPTPGTNTSAAYWRRVGDTMEIRYEFSQTTAGSSGTGVYKFPLPSGYAVDTTKSNSAFTSIAQSFGQATAYNGTIVMEGHVQAFDSTNLYMYVGEATTGTSNVSSTFMQLGQATVRYGFEAKVPIVGWSSNVQLSSDAGNSRYVFSANKVGGTFTASTNVSGFTNILKNDGSAWNNTSGEYTVQSPGDFKVELSFAAATSNNVSRIYRTRSGTTTTLFTGDGYASNGFHGVRGLVADCIAGDIITIKPTSTATLGGAAEDNTISIYKLSSPQTIAASDTVSASYKSTAGGSIGTSYTLQSFATKFQDTHGAWNGNTFTAPMSGTYRVSSNIRSGNLSLGATQSFENAVYKNGSIYMLLNSIIGNGGANNWYTSGGSIEVPLLAGETIQIWAKASVAGSQNTDPNSNFVSIVRVGNY